MERSSEKGFTLIEILVVGIILSILVAVTIPRMGFQFSANRLRSSTSAVTSSFYLARMKAVNDGEDYGVKFYENGEIDIVRDPYGSNEILAPTNRIENTITFADITFNEWLAVFTPFGQLDKNCLPSGQLTGYVYLADDKGDTTQVEVTMVTGRIKETNL